MGLIRGPRLLSRLVAQQGLLALASIKELPKLRRLFACQSVIPQDAQVHCPRYGQKNVVRATEVTSRTK